MAPADGTPLLVSICLLSASGGGYNLADDADAIRESYHIVDTHQRYQGIQNYLIKPVAAAPSRSNMTDARQETPDANNLGGTCYYEDKSGGIESIDGLRSPGSTHCGRRLIAFPGWRAMNPMASSG
jgi:hypothetical protein